MRSLALVALLLPAVPLARDPAPRAQDGNCNLRIEGKDGVVRSGDVEVRPGEPARDVVAIGGTVRVKAGAVASDVVAIGGSVVVEKGAVVHGTATAIGGDVQADAGAKVEGGASAVGGRVRAAEGAVGGKKSTVNVEIDGQPLAARVQQEVRSELRKHDCRVEIHEHED